MTKIESLTKRLEDKDINPREKELVERELTLALGQRDNFIRLDSVKTDVS